MANPADLSGDDWLQKLGITHTPASMIDRRFVVLGRAFRTSAGGIEVPSDSGSSVIDYYGLYLTISEYKDFFGAKWTPTSAIWAAQEMAGLLPRELFVRILAELRCHVESSRFGESLIDDYEHSLAETDKIRLRNTLRTQVPKRAFLVREQIVQAFNLVLRNSPIEGQISTQGNVDPVQLLNIAIELCHVLAETSGLRNQSDKEIRFGSPEFDELALYITTSALFYSRDDPLTTLARTRRLWKIDSNRARLQLSDRRLEEVFEQVVGMPIDIHIAVVLSLYRAIAYGEFPLAVIYPQIPGEKWSTQFSSVLTKISIPIEDDSSEWPSQLSQWDLSVLVRRPCIRLDDGGLVVTDSALLLERMTHGVLEEVAEGLARDGASPDLHGAWGHVVEEYVKERIAPIAQSRGFVCYGESEYTNAYPGTGKRKPDLIVDDGENIVIFEVMKGGVSGTARSSQSVKKFQEELQWRIFEKIRQLDEVILHIDRQPERLLRRRESGRCIPLIVSGDGLSHNVVLDAYIRELCSRESRFAAPNSIRPVIVDLAEVELLEAFMEQGLDPAKLILEWMTSELATVSLKNFLLVRFADSDIQYRSRSLEIEFQDSIRQIWNQFGWPEKENSPLSGSRTIAYGTN